LKHESESGQERGLIRYSYNLLNVADRRKTILVALFQTLLSFLDLIGVAMLGILGALSISGIQSREPSESIKVVLKAIGAENFSFQNQVALLAGLAVFFLLGRTALSALVAQKTFKFLSIRSAECASRLGHNVLHEPLLKTQERLTQYVIFGMTGGVNSLIVGLIGSLVLLLADLSLLVVLFVGLIYIDVSLAFGTIIFFGTIGYMLHRAMSKTASQLGAENSRLQMNINNLISEALLLKREIFVRNKINSYVTKIKKQKIVLAEIEARQAFLPNISKYVLESGVLIGVLLISGYQFIVNDASRAIGTISIFLAAGFRIAPAVLRVQQGLLSIKIHAGASQPARELIRSVGLAEKMEINGAEFTFNHENFYAECSLSQVNFKYPHSDSWALRNVNLFIREGEFIAIVGNSGSGKTTLIDVLLGVIKPDTGEVSISGCAPETAIQKWPGAISYAPQETTIISGTIAENVSLGYSGNEIRYEEINRAIRESHLENHVASLEEGLETSLGERGSGFSGGQRQRLGIARALYTKPKLLVLDEATSALDAETESLISQSLSELQGKVSIIAIAHRLSTVQQADKVVYMDNGEILVQGTFEEVRSQIHNFDEQAKLLGL
jgi:ABC-type multidrug transport system fused ATPase/permease subunit